MLRLTAKKRLTLMALLTTVVSSVLFGKSFDDVKGGLEKAITQVRKATHGLSPVVGLDALPALCDWLVANNEEFAPGTAFSSGWQAAVSRANWSWDTKLFNPVSDALGVLKRDPTTPADYWLRLRPKLLEAVQALNPYKKDGTEGFIDFFSGPPANFDALFSDFSDDIDLPINPALVERGGQNMKQFFIKLVTWLHDNIGRQVPELELLKPAMDADAADQIVQAQHAKELAEATLERFKEEAEKRFTLVSDQARALLDQERLKIAAAETRATDAEGKVAGLENAKSALEAQVTPLQAQVKALEAAVLAAQQAQQAAVSDATQLRTVTLKGATDRLSTVEAELLARQSELDAAAERINQFQVEMMEATRERRKALDDLAIVQGQLTLAEQRVATLEKAEQDANVKIAALEARVQDVEALLASSELRATNFEAQARQLTLDLTTAQKNVRAAVEELDLLRPQLAAAELEVTQQSALAQKSVEQAAALQQQLQQTEDVLRDEQDKNRVLTDGNKTLDQQRQDLDDQNRDLTRQRDDWERQFKAQAGQLIAVQQEVAAKGKDLDDAKAQLTSVEQELLQAQKEKGLVEAAQVKQAAELDQLRHVAQQLEHDKNELETIKIPQLEAALKAAQTALDFARQEAQGLRDGDLKDALERARLAQDEVAQRQKDLELVRGRAAQLETEVAAVKLQQADSLQSLDETKKERDAGAQALAALQMSCAALANELAEVRTKYERSQQALTSDGLEAERLEQQLQEMQKEKDLRDGALKNEQVRAADLERQLQICQAQLGDAERQRASAVAQNTTLQKEVVDANAQVVLRADELKRATERDKDLEAELAALRQERGQLASAKAALEKELADGVVRQSDDEKVFEQSLAQLKRDVAAAQERQAEIEAERNALQAQLESATAREREEQQKASRLQELEANLQRQMQDQQAALAELAAKYELAQQALTGDGMTDQALADSTAELKKAAEQVASLRQELDLEKQRAGEEAERAKVAQESLANSDRELAALKASYAALEADKEKLQAGLSTTEDRQNSDAYMFDRELVQLKHQLESARGDGEELMRELASLRADKRQHDEQLVQVRKDLDASLLRREEALRKALEADRGVQEFRQRAVALERENGDLKKANSALQDRSLQADQSSGRFSAELLKLSNENQVLHDQIAPLQAQAKAAQAELEELRMQSKKDLDRQAQTLSEEVQGAKEREQEAQARATAAQRESGELRNRLSSAEAVIGRASDAQVAAEAKAARLEKRVGELEALVNELRTQLSAKEKEVVDERPPAVAEEKAAAFDPEIEERRRAAEQEGRRAELEQIALDVKNAEAELNDPAWEKEASEVSGGRADSQHTLEMSIQNADAALKKQQKNLEMARLRLAEVQAERDRGGSGVGAKRLANAQRLKELTEGAQVSVNDSEAAVVAADRALALQENALDRWQIAVRARALRAEAAQFYREKLKDLLKPTVPLTQELLSALRANAAIYKGMQRRARELREGIKAADRFTERRESQLHPQASARLLKFDEVLGLLNAEILETSVGSEARRILEEAKQEIVEVKLKTLEPILLAADAEDEKGVDFYFKLLEAERKLALAGDGGADEKMELEHAKTALAEGRSKALDDELALRKEGDIVVAAAEKMVKVAIERSRAVRAAEDAHAATLARRKQETPIALEAESDKVKVEKGRQRAKEITERIAEEGSGATPEERQAATRLEADILAIAHQRVQRAQGAIDDVWQLVQEGPIDGASGQSLLDVYRRDTAPLTLKYDAKLMELQAIADALAARKKVASSKTSVPPLDMAKLTTGGSANSNDGALVSAHSAMSSRTPRPSRRGVPRLSSGARKEAASELASQTPREVIEPFMELEQKVSGLRSKVQADLATLEKDRAERGALAQRAFAGAASPNKGRVELLDKELIALEEQRKDWGENALKGVELALSGGGPEGPKTPRDKGEVLANMEAGYQQMVDPLLRDYASKLTELRSLAAGAAAGENIVVEPADSYKEPVRTRGGDPFARVEK